MTVSLTVRLAAETRRVRVESESLSCHESRAGSRPESVASVAAQTQATVTAGHGYRDRDSSRSRRFRAESGATHGDGAQARPEHRDPFAALRRRRERLSLAVPRSGH